MKHYFVVRNTNDESDVVIKDRDRIIFDNKEFNYTSRTVDLLIRVYRNIASKYAHPFTESFSQ